MSIEQQVEREPGVRHVGPRNLTICHDSVNSFNVESCPGRDG